MSNLQELAPEEKAKPYSKYYYMKPAAPDPEIFEWIQPGKPMEPLKALLPENINDLLTPGYHEVEVGYCVLPNGAGYVAMNTKMPGVTAEMVDWWMVWHSMEELRYKIWWPQGHYGISINEDARKKALDASLPFTKRIHGVTHHAVEDVGIGKEDIFISFLSPQDMGFDVCLFNEINVATIVAANGVSSPVGAPPGTPKVPAVMCHFIREIPGGIEYRTRFWLGYQMVDKRPKLLLPPGVRLPEMVPFGLARHNALEYSNLRSILPKVYEEQKEFMV